MAFVKNDNHQISLADSVLSLSQREKMFLEKSWSVPFAEEIFPRIHEEDFAVLYSNKAYRFNNL